MVFKHTKDYKKFFLSLICFWAIGCVYSQNVKFKRISIDDGLSAVSVNTIMQDSQDFIWVGTQDGLNRYDGYHIKTFKSDQYDKHSLSNNYINCLHEDNGNIYIGTNGGGLSVFNKLTENFTSYKSGLSTKQISKNISNNYVRHITELNDNELLIATEDGLNVFDKTTKMFFVVRSYDSLFPADLKFIYKDLKNRVFIVSYGNGLFEYKPESKILIHHELPDNYLKEHKDKTPSEMMNMRCITEVDGKIWCGTDEGILMFDPETKKFEKVVEIGAQEYTKYNNRIISFARDKNTNFLWIGTWGGLVKYNLNNSSYTIYNNNELDPNSLSDNKISCLIADNQQNLWIGTQDNGLNVYFPSSAKFPLYNSTNGLTNDFIYSILETSDKTIWVGTADGFYMKEPKDIEFKNVTSIISKYESKTVLSLCKDKTGRIWIGTYGQGVIIYDPKTKTSQKLLGDDQLGGTVIKIIQTENDVMWIGTYQDGLYSVNPKTLTIRRYTVNQGLSSDKIYSLFENLSDKTLWVGTDGGGLCILDFIKNVDRPYITYFKHQENANSISSNAINNIYKDKNGFFWIATSDGLNKFDYKKKTFKVYTEKDGLPNSYIYDVIPDNKGNFWLPTNFGLANFNPNIENENGSAFKNYNTKDGIQAREFNQGASFLCSDGKILVGGISGLNYFNPSELKENKIAPHSYIYSFGRQGKEIKTDSSIIFKKYIELSYKENYFTFELIALDFISPDKNKFMYKLEGYDNEWSTPSTVRYVSYTELPGGNYTFKVKATNNDGVWNEVPYEIKIKVIPPWWKTNWFYVTASILSIIVVFGFISYRTNSIKKENKVLENKVTQRTRELAEKNRDITSSIEYAKRIQEAILPSQELIFSKLRNAFIYYKPKDIVSGDFYWFGERNNYKIFAVVDCTGHGVPGAFMSMIGHNLLNQIVGEKGLTDPGSILNELHKGVQAALKQGQNQINTNDGMDVALVAINTDTREILYAGAFRSLVIVTKEGELEKIEGNKYPVGGAQLDSERIFTTHSRKLEKQDCIYMFSDGYADQFGGDKGKKFMVKRFHDILTSIHEYSILEQHKELDRQFNDWKKSFAQVDDVLVVGIKM